LLGHGLVGRLLGDVDFLLELVAGVLEIELRPHQAVIIDRRVGTGAVQV
jgi:hypothetical protein